MRVKILAAAAISAIIARGDLDRIDADGVTDVGGSSSYARMLPRTGSSGKLDSSLLPPVADWASQPLPCLYYVAAGSAAGGNGAPQYPFNTIAAAVSAASSGSSVLVAPGTYSGTIALPSGKSVTLCGFGRGTYISSLNVTGSGSSSLNLCGLKVGTLRKSMATLSLGLSHASVDSLTGTLTGLSVTRHDMGAVIYTASSAYSDAYDGNGTAPKANGIVSADGSRTISMSGDRTVMSRVGRTAVVAYLDDVAEATNATFVAIRSVQDTASGLSASLAAEAAARASGDASVSNAMETAVTNMQGRIEAIGTSWSDQASALSSNIGKIGSTLATLAAKETNDVATITASILSVRADFATADNLVKSTLRAEISDALETAHDDAQDVADERFAVNMASVRPSIVNEAVAKAGTNAAEMVSTVNGLAESNRDRIDSLEDSVEGHDADLASLESDVLMLSGGLTVLDEREESDVANLNASIAAANTARAAACSALSEEMAAGLFAVSNSIPAIADTRAGVVLAANRSGIISDAVTQSSAFTTGVVTPLANTVTTLSSTVSGLSSASTSHGNRLNSLESNYSTLNGRVTSMGSTVIANYNNLSSRFSEVNNWQSGANTKMANMRVEYKDKINAILALMRKLAAGQSIKGETVPSDIPASL